MSSTSKNLKKSLTHRLNLEKNQFKLQATTEQGAAVEAQRVALAAEEARLARPQPGWVFWTFWGNRTLCRALVVKELEDPVGDGQDVGEQAGHRYEMHFDTDPKEESGTYFEVWTEEHILGAVSYTHLTLPTTPYV